MAVAHDAVSESHTGTTGHSGSASFTWNHVPVGTPKGVVVFVIGISSATDIITSVTYGGTAMTAVTSGFAADTANEPGFCKAYFLGASIPTGTQAVVVNRTNNANVCYAMCATQTADSDTAYAGVQTQAENQVRSEINIDDGSPGTNSLRYAGAYNGASSNPAAGANSTNIIGIQFAAQGAGMVRENTAGQGARPVGFSGLSDDWAAVFLAVKESASGSTTPISMSATAVGVASLTKTSTFLRTLAVVAVGLSSISSLSTRYRALVVTNVGIAGLSKVRTSYLTLAPVAVGLAGLAKASVYDRTLTAVAVGAATLSKVPTFVRGLAAVAVGTSSLSKVVTFGRTLTATSVGAASLSRGYYKALTATAVGVAAQTFALLSVQTLAATAVGVTTLGRLTTFTRALAASAVGVSGLNRMATYYRSLSATSVGSPVLSGAVLIKQNLAATVIGVVSLLPRTTFHIALSALGLSQVEVTYTIEYATSIPVDTFKYVKTILHRIGWL